MMPAEAINMEMYRAMWGRHEQFSVDPYQYAELGHLFGADAVSRLARGLSATEAAKVDILGRRSHGQSSARACSER